MARFTKNSTMKHCLPLLLLFAFISCKKDKNTNPPPVLGTWEIRETRASAREIIKRYSPGNDTILKFTVDTYEYYVAGQRISNGTYKLVKKQDGYYIEYDNNDNAIHYYTYENRRLVTSYRGITMDRAYDYVYERVNQ